MYIYEAHKVDQYSLKNLMFQVLNVYDTKVMMDHKVENDKHPRII
jgi:hypothetical protein